MEHDSPWHRVDKSLDSPTCVQCSWEYQRLHMQKGIVTYLDIVISTC